VIGRYETHTNTTLVGLNPSSFDASNPKQPNDSIHTNLKHHDVAHVLEQHHHGQILVGSGATGVREMVVPKGCERGCASPTLEALKHA